MKFRFKIQQYQTDAVDSVVRVFNGQHYSDGVSYNRDLGEPAPLASPAGWGAAAHVPVSSALSL